MVESAKRHVDILEKLNFYDYAISLKASNLDLCISAYEEAAKTFNCPLHLGITEAGTEFSGTIKSSIGLGILLREGIGDTLRVSLSDDPIKEIKKQIHIPIVADIHFDYRIALEAIDAGVDKVRINPGNIGSEERVKMVVDKCKEKNIMENQLQKQW